MNKPQKIYMIGIKGVGMTMLAQFLAKAGHRVSGSDITDEFMTDRVLKREKIKVFSPFSVNNISGSADLIIHSSAFSAENNPELAFIKSQPRRFKKIRVLSYAEALGEIFSQYYGLAVCGSHGKTTTSAWLGYVLWRSGKQPNVLVGSRVPQFQGSGLKGTSRYLVAEVDEYQNKLQYFKPRGVILNNIDYDHPDFFKTRASYTKAFADFLKKIPARGFLVTNQGDRESRQIRKYCAGKVISYDLVRGDFGRGADYLAYDCRTQNGYQSFALSYQGRPLGRFKIKLWGEHNILNALAVIAASRQLKVAWPDIRKHLASFTGTERRTQVLGRYHGALIIDDYAHHPTEIISTLQGLRSHYGDKRLITVFHPHTFTRTKALFSDFVRSFTQTDELIILDIYGSAREKQGGVSSSELVAAIKKYNQAQGRSQMVKYLKNIPQATTYLRSRLGSGDLLILLGAGDVFRVGQYLLK
ncbi:MAG: UDP-N-acetylmuramate--L-alanine ligase [Patescibacteria group bacterium]